MADHDQIFEIIRHEHFLPFRIVFHSRGFCPFHWHSDLEFIFCVQGELEILIKSEIKVIREGELVFINSLDIHSTHTRKNSIAMVIQIASDYGKKLGASFSDLYFCTDSLNRSSEISRLFLEIGIEYCDKSNAYQFMIESLIDNILVKLLRSSRQEQQREHFEESNNFRIIKIIKELEANYSKNISVSNIASELNMSAEYLSRYFHFHIGCSIRDYISRLRVFHSLPYFGDGKSSINQISKSVGFSDLKTYRNAFEKIFGASPEEWKGQHSIQLKHNTMTTYSSVESQSIRSRLQRLMHSI